MKKIFLTLSFFTIIFTASYSQDKSNITYTSKAMYLQAVNDKGDEVSLIPMSNNVTIIYDTFYKSFTIIPIMEDGIGEIKLTYLKTEKNGSIKMLDKDGMIHYVINSISLDGRLRILRNKVVSGLLSWYIIKDVKLGLQ